MELAELHVFEPEIFEPYLYGIGGNDFSASQRPYIKGHITGGASTFTFKVNGSDVTVSVSGGDWKYKPTATITSFAFVGVPQLESLELDNITGVSTFNLDYPVVPVFKKCDATTEAALNYVYHIRGTATEDFTFTLKYIDDNDTVTTVTESAVIDGNGKWDVAYSGKKVSDLNATFKNNTKLKTITLTEELDECTSVKDLFSGCSAITSISLLYASLEGVDDISNVFNQCTSLIDVNMPYATMENVTQSNGAFRYTPSLKNVIVPSLSKAIKLTSDQAYTWLNFRESPLTFVSMLAIARWVNNFTNYTMHSTCFSKPIYDALSEDEKAELLGIFTSKKWNVTTQDP